MESLFIYTLKTNGLLLLFWIIYRLFLKQESFYTLNRFYFLFSIIFSCIIPGIFYTQTIWLNPEPISNTSPLTQSNINEILVVESINYFEILGYIVLLISCVKILLTLYKIGNTIHYINYLDSDFAFGTKIDSKSKTVYSFLHWIVVSPEILLNKDVDLILKHEQIHINHKHSIDLIIIELLKRVFWFNPLLILFQKDCILNHEFEVDAAVIQNENKIRYQLCLLQIQLQNQSSILCTFNQSDLKKRIIHINNQKSKTMKKLKFLFSIPVLILFFTLFQVKTEAQILSAVPTKKMSPIVTDTIKPIYILDGKQINESQFRKLDSKDIKSINVLKDKTAIDKYGKKGKNGVIEINTVNELITKNNKEEIKISSVKDSSLKAIDTIAKKRIKAPNVSNKSKETKPLILVDNLEVNYDINTIDPNTIKSINILKNEDAIAKYGDKGKNGVIEVLTKQNIEETAINIKKLN